MEVPLMIDFAAPSSLRREVDRPSALPIVGNGPPGTFVAFPEGVRVSLPTDQIILAEDIGGRARVGFGGMQFVGIEDDQLAFVRVRELHPEVQLSPARSHRMLLDRRWVSSIRVDGHEVWAAV